MTLIIPFYPSDKTLSEFKILIKSIENLKLLEKISIILINHENIIIPIKWQIYIRKYNIQLITLNLSNDKFYTTTYPESFWHMIPTVYIWCLENLKIDKFIFTEPDIMLTSNINLNTLANCSDIIVYNNSKFMQTHIYTYVFNGLLKKYKLPYNYKYHYDTWFIYNIDIDTSYKWLNLSEKISKLIPYDLNKNHSLLMQHFNEEIALSIVLNSENNNKYLSVIGDKIEDITNSYFYHFDDEQEGLSKLNNFNNHSCLSKKIKIEDNITNINLYIEQLDNFIEFGIFDKNKEYYDYLNNIFGIKNDIRFKYNFKDS